MPKVHPALLAMTAVLVVAPALHVAHAAEPETHDGGVDAKPELPVPKSKKAGRGPVALDPMLDLRERLAATLGASKTEGRGEQVVRVSTQPDGELQLASQPAPAPRRQGPKPAVKGVHEWSYGGESGPQAWGRLQPEFSKCASGTRQSPIDIRDGIRVDLEPVQFDYQPSAFRVLDNGHTVQVNVAPGNSIEVMGRRFELTQFHFHRPSEERIEGRSFDMVAHLVHKDAGGRLAVVAVLLERGAAHPLVQSVWNNLPLEKGDEVGARTPLDLNQLLPKDTRYFIYMGSLTTPPC